jgi:hypothetical protein
MTFGFFNLKYASIASYGSHVEENALAHDFGCNINSSSFRSCLLGRKYTCKLSLSRVHFLRGLAFFISQRSEEGRRKEDRPREHYRRLVEESFSQWLYFPCSSKGQILIQRMLPNAPSSDFINYESEVPPYFEQCLEHLRAYPDIQKLLDDASIICNGIEGAKIGFSIKTEIRSILKTSIDELQIKFSNHPESQLLSNFSDLLFRQIGDAARYPSNPLTSDYPELSSDKSHYKILAFELGDWAMTLNFAKVLSKIRHDDSLKARWSEQLKAQDRLERELKENIENFQRMIRIEIVEKTRSLDYTHMKGKCDDCRRILK